MEDRGTRATMWGVIALLIGAAMYAVVMLVVFGEIAVGAQVAAGVLGVAAIPAGCAVIVARARPRHIAAPLLAAAAASLVVTNLPRGDRLGPFTGSWMALYLPLAFLLLTVPTGRLVSSRWRWVGWGLIGIAVVFNVICVVDWSRPQAVSPAWGALVPVFMGLLIACAVAPMARYRAADGDQRVQLRWVLVAGILLPLCLLLCWASYLVLGSPDLVAVGLAMAYLGIPVTVTIALVGPRAFDVDRAAVATASALALSVVALAGLSVACAVAGAALVSWSPPAAIATTSAMTIAAVAAFPLVRRGFDRLLYPTRHRAVVALRRFAVDVESARRDPEEVEQVLREALGDPGLVVAVRRSGTAGAGGDRTTRPRPGRSDSARTLHGADVVVDGTAVAVRARGEEIGYLIPSGPARPPAAAARAAAPFVDAARSRAQLALAMAEVEASRERLLRAGYEERRRLERDLHDGAQQRLVALGMRLRVLQRDGAVGVHVADELDGAVAELGTAVAELRRLSQGVRPSALDDGLRPALADLVRQAPEMIELEVPHLDLPDAVATTAYYVVSEAVTNALRHASAERIRVAVTAMEQQVRVRVNDDGIGGAELLPRGGLTGLSDRVRALGGTLTVTSTAGSGTAVEAVLPCAL